MMMQRKDVPREGFSLKNYGIQHTRFANRYFYSLVVRLQKIQYQKIDSLCRHINAILLIAVYAVEIRA